MIIFHGGCHGCTRQETQPVDDCARCMYFDADWHLPDLNNRPETEAERVRREVKGRRAIRKILEKKDWRFWK